MKPSCGPLSRHNLLPAAILLLTAALLPAYTWHQGTSGFLTDDGLYLLMADFFSPWHEGNIYMDYIAMKTARFPPAFPVLLALFGGGSQSMAAAHLVTGGCLVAAGWMFYIWARGRLEWPPLALACLFLFLTLPESLLYVLELRSELLYLVFTFAALATMTAALRSGGHERELFCLAAILVGLCMQARTIGVAMLAAFLILLAVNKVRRAWLYLAIAAALPAIWYVIKAINGYSSTYVDDVTRYTSYEGLWRLIADDMPRNAWLLVESWNANLAVRAEAAWPLEALSLALLALVLTGFVDRIRRHAPDAWYVVFYLGVILVWPHPDHMVRFVYPLMPIALVYMFLGTRWLVPGAPAQARIHAFVVLALLGLTYPNVIAVIDRFHVPMPSHVPDDFRHTRVWLTRDDPAANRIDAEAKHTVIELLRKAPRYLERHDCLYTAHVPFTMVYSQRPARSLPVRPSLEKLYKCRYLFVMNLTTKHPAMYPLERLDHRRLEPVDIEHDSRGRRQAYLFRIHR